MCSAACTVAVPLDHLGCGEECEPCADCGEPPGPPPTNPACEPECLYGAACVDGLCSVVTLVTADERPLMALAASDEHVVMTTDEMVWRLVDGHAEEVFGFVANSRDIVVSGDRAYWGAENGVHCYPLAGSAQGDCAGEIVTTPEPVVAVALADGLYYATSDGTVAMVDFENQLPTLPLSAGGLPAGRLVASGAWIGWTHELAEGNGYGLNTVAAGFTYEPCAPSLALGGDSLFFAHGTKLLLKDFGNDEDPEAMASSPFPIGEVAFDAARQRVLWSDLSGAIHALDIATGATTVLARDQGSIGRLAPNGDGVYFLAGGALHFVQR